MSDQTESRERRKMIQVPVPIPAEDGRSVAETVMVPVSAVYDPASGEYLLDGEALDAIDRVKARHMGLLQPEQIRELRVQLGMTQQQMAVLLQIGQKTCTRWETGRERPSRSMNLLLKALQRGRLDAAFLESFSMPHFSWTDAITCVQPAKRQAAKPLSVYTLEDNPAEVMDNADISLAA
jgi:DNA-binding transcriptional regulator YiaG